MNATILRLVLLLASLALTAGCDSFIVDCDTTCGTQERVNSELSCEVAQTRAACMDACEAAAIELPAQCVLASNLLTDCQAAAPQSAWSCSMNPDEGPTFSLNVGCETELGELLSCLQSASAM